MRLFFIAALLSLQLCSAGIVYQGGGANKVAITFDDGPNPHYTNRILAVLDAHDVPATFFMVGQHIKRFPDIAKAVQAAGHELANHSYHHLDYSKLSAEEILRDVYESQMMFYEVLGEFPLYFRPPYGRLRKDSLPYLGRYYDKVINWSVDTRDWSAKTSDSDIMQVVKSKLLSGSIILFHDNNPKTLRTLPKVIRYIKQNGYQIVPVSEVL